MFFTYFPGEQKTQIMYDKKQIVLVNVCFAISRNKKKTPRDLTFVIFPFEEFKVNAISLMINKPQPLNHRLKIRDSTYKIRRG